MKLSIVILTFNSEKYIKECIESVYEAYPDKKNFEILVLDNGSDDNTVEIVSEDKNCKVFNFPVFSMGTSRNFGLSKAKGKYISFIDCDDRFTKNRFTRHLKILENDPNIDNVIGVSKLFLKEKNKFGYKKFTLGRKLNIDDYFEGKCYSLCGITYRRDFLVSNNIKFEEGIRGKFGEDWYFQTLCELKKQYSQIDLQDSALIQIREDSFMQIDVQRKAKCLSLIRLLEFHNSGIKVKFLTLLKLTLKYNLSKTFNKKSEFDLTLEDNLKIFFKRNPLRGFFIKIALKNIPFSKNFVIKLREFQSKISFKNLEV